MKGVEYDKFYELYKAGLESRENSLQRFEDLLSRSEMRIDRTNEMISELAGIVKTLTQEYSSHLHDLTVCRDNLVKENQELIRSNKEFQKYLSEMQRKYDQIIDRLLGYVNPGPGTNITVKN